jgi:hypothetical protein
MEVRRLLGQFQPAVGFTGSFVALRLEDSIGRRVRDADAEMQVLETRLEPPSGEIEPSAL